MPDNERMSGNKGEWSELYVFLKLLAQGRLYAADDRAERIDDVYYPILKIIREETDYIINEENIGVEVGGRQLMTVSRSEMEDVSEELFREILRHTGSFELEEIKEYANGIRVTKLKAPSSDTTDILVQMQDVHTGFAMNTGFSIKSEVGAAPTLINASEATNFIYKVTGISEDQADEINAINTRTKIRDRLLRIRELGGSLTYSGIFRDQFRRNLIMVDGDMPKIIGEMLLYFYLEDIKDCSALINLLGERDPLGYGETVMYESKLKRFLCDSALGMKPTSSWDGTDEANGGYIIVKSNGEIVAYTLYNRDAFRQYLLDNTYFERGSTTRHRYMQLYMENEEMYLNLNLQVRFKMALSAEI